MLVDANVLLYAVDRTSPFHERCAGWLEEQLNAELRVGIPWESLNAFLRISTHPRASRSPIKVSTAWSIVEDWLAAPAVWIPAPTQRHEQVLAELIDRYEPHGNLVPDAHLAAIAIQHGLGVCSADTDFARFTEISWFNPLAA